MHPSAPPRGGIAPPFRRPWMALPGVVLGRLTAFYNCAGVDILTKKQKLCPQDLRNSAPVIFLWALITRDSQIICNFS